MTINHHRCAGDVRAVLAALLQSGAFVLELTERIGASARLVYPVLRRLEADGLIRGTWREEEDQAANKLVRRFYEVTPRGRAALQQCGQG